MTSRKTVLVTVATLAFAGQLHAAERATSQMSDLRDARDRVARAAGQTKGSPQHLYLQQEQRLSDLIDDLEQGRRVDPAAIDRALQQANQPTP